MIGTAAARLAWAALTVDDLADELVELLDLPSPLLLDGMLLEAPILHLALALERLEQLLDDLDQQQQQQVAA